MNVLEAIQTRRSIRRFMKKPIEKEKLTRILESARLSPSANNNQPWHFILITEKKAKENLFPAYPRNWFVEAPAIIAVCIKPNDGWSRQDGEKYWKLDAAIAMQSIMLTSHDFGIGSCCIAAFDEKKAKKVLEIPNNTRLIALICLGYPIEKKDPVTDRKKLEEIVHYQHW
ncbi:MAG: hypothetical protein AC479_06065 [miscellaneous Crenarchaeota group-6 archaeon AD8-1]|nr:MAG: hypothetical protein AC479_06065 [miscellaneous Crenarchaeota group-6 archaeon AD8-1]